VGCGPTAPRPNNEAAISNQTTSLDPEPFFFFIAMRGGGETDRGVNKCPSGPNQHPVSVSVKEPTTL